MKKKILFLLIGLSLFTSSFSFVNAYLWRDTQGEHDISGLEWTQRTFYSNYSNRFYMLYDFTNASGTGIGYSWSFDGITWSDRYFLLGHYSQNLGAKTFDFFLQSNGSHIHFAYLRSSDDLYYWLMVINSTDGRIMRNPDVPFTEQQVIDGGGWQGIWEPRDEVSIVVDSEGYATIGAECDGGGAGQSYFAWTNTLNNGSWPHEVFTQHLIETEWINNGNGNPPNTVWGGKLFPIWGKDFGLVFWYMNLGANQQLHRSMYWDDSASDWVDNTGSIDNDNEGGDWAEYCWGLGYNYYNLTVVFKQHESNPEGQIGLEAWFYDGLNHAWENQTQISFDEAGDAGSTVFNPLVSVRNTGSVNFLWNVGNATYWARRMWGNGTLEDWFAVETLPFTIGSNLFSTSHASFSPTPIYFEDDTGGNDWLYFNLLGFLDDDWASPASHLNTTLYNQDGTINDGWIFEGEVYNLVSYIFNATNFFVNTSDSRHDIGFQWNNETEQMWISVDPDDQFTIGLPWSNYTRFDGNITRLQWRFIPDRSIVDVQNSTWDFRLENSNIGLVTTGTLGFNTTIYNLGGFVSYDFNGDAGKITGGDSFEIWAENSTGGAYAYAETVFRKLQGVHLLYSLDVEDGDCFDHHEQTGYVEMGIQFRYNNSWVDGWYYHLIFVNGAVDPAGTPGKAWMIPQVEWYSRSAAGTVLNPRDDLISAYPETGDDVNNDRTEIRFWVDLWFNRMNASEVVGGRVNAYYFGMDQGGFLGWAGWAPVILNETSSMYFDDLRLPDGNITDSLEIEMVKFWVEVGKTGSGAPAGGDCDDHRWALRNYEILNWKLAPDRMQGIDTPIFVETKSIEFPSTGFLQPLYKAIDGLATAIWAGALGFQKILWGAMDSFFAWAGFGEGFFSMITAFLMTLPDIFISLMEFMPVLLIEMAEIIEAVFMAIVLMIPMYTISIGTMIETIMDYWHILTQILNGQILPFDIIQDIQLGDWINAGITMLPTYEIFGIIFDDNPGRRAEERMRFYSSLFGGLIGFLKGFIVLMQQVIQTIMDILPG